MSYSSQFARHLELLRVLSRNSMCNKYTEVSELENELGVSRRTIYRDFKVLEAAGFTLKNPPGHMAVKGIKLTNPLEFSNKKLNFHDVVELYLSSEFLSLKESDPDTYIKKLLSSLECSMKDNPNSTMKRVKSLIKVYKPAPRKYLGAKSQFTIISEALRSKKKLHISYYSAYRGAEEWRVVHPYQCTWTNTTAYVEAFCEKANDMRTFAINRMRTVKILDDVFVRNPKYDTYSNDKGFILHDGDPQEICLVFDAEVSYHATERDWFKEQKTKTLPDGRVEIRFSASGLQQMAGFVLRWGGNIEVVEPAELRQLVYNGAKRCSEKNAPNNSSSVPKSQAKHPAEPTSKHKLI